MISRLRSATVGGALVAALGLAGIGLAGTGAQPAAAADGDVQVTDGTFEWGIRASIRNYLENFDHTEGSISAYNGATYTTGDSAIVFSKASGWANESQGTAEVSFDGEVEMLGFGESWLWFDNLRVQIDGESADIVVDMTESFNTKEPTADVVLASYPVDGDTIAVADGSVSLNLTDGLFSTAAWDEHLPKLGGAPTYGPPNDMVDDASASLVTEGEATDPEPTDPEPTDPEPTDPEPTDPVPTPTVDPDPNDEVAYGVSQGEPLSGTESYITVTPGYALDADGATLVRIEGFNFNPGPATEPGTGSGGIYVGFGQAANPGTEEWRRSKGGFTGPGADLDYGSPRFVAHQNSADGEVADAMMDASGYWSFTVEVPGAAIPSFFGGGEIDCLASQCGVFSFGAHGVINADNEAYTPVYFTGQDESDWPPRGDSDEPPVSAPEQLPTLADLTDANRGQVSILNVGTTNLTAQVPDDLAGSWIGAVVLSDPQFAGWVRVNDAGRIDVRLPGDLAEGDHTLAIVNAAGDVVGWAPFIYEQPEPIDDNDDGKTTPPSTEKNPHGESTGTNEAGATLTVSPAYELADKSQVVTLTGEGYPTQNAAGSNFGGAYILFGWIDPDAGTDWAPSKGGTTGFTYVYIEGEDNQSIVSYPGNTTTPGFPEMDADGNWEAEYTIAASQFTAFNQQITATRCSAVSSRSVRTARRMPVPRCSRQCSSTRMGRRSTTTHAPVPQRATVAPAAMPLATPSRATASTPPCCSRRTTDARCCSHPL